VSPPPTRNGQEPPHQRSRTGDLDNLAVAERLEEFAALLDLAGSSYYTARAYRRAAELIRGLHTSVADLVRSGHVRELRGIGPGIEARLRELVETGRIEELDELENEVRLELVGFGRLLGLSAKRSVEIKKAPGCGGIRTDCSEWSIVNCER